MSNNAAASVELNFKLLLFSDKSQDFVSATILCFSLHFMFHKEGRYRERKSESSFYIILLALCLLCMETTGERIKEA